MDPIKAWYETKKKRLATNNMELLIKQIVHVEMHEQQILEINTQ
jgi:hypothetical protein